MLSCYYPRTKFAKVMFLNLYVSHSVHRGGVSRPRAGGGMGGLPGGVQAQALWSLHGVVCPGPGPGG